MSDIRYCIHGKLIAPAPKEMRCPHGCTRQASEAEIVENIGVAEQSALSQIAAVLTQVRNEDLTIIDGLAEIESLVRGATL